MTDAADDDVVHLSVVFDYLCSGEETRNRAVESGGGRSSSDGKEQGGTVEDSVEGVTSGEEETGDLADRMEGPAIEGKGRFAVEERVKATALVASEANVDKKAAAIKNKGKKVAVEEEEDQKEESLAVPGKPLEPNSSGCTFCGVFYWSTDGYTTYKPFPSGKPESGRWLSGLSLDFLPEPIHVVASSYGLLFCRATWVSGRYYACNPATLDWIKLPFPPNPEVHGDDTAVALVFEKSMTACRFESDYHVVCAYPIPGLDGGGVYAFHVFSSKTWRWTSSKEICFAELLIPTSGVGVDGKACWTTTMNTAVIFDPAKDEIQTVPWPVGYSDRDVTWSLVELQGELSAVCVQPAGADNVGAHVYTLQKCREGGGAATLGWRKKHGMVFQVPESACPLPGQSTTEILFKNGKELLVVDVFTGTCRTIGGDDDPIVGNAFLPYTSSLVGACGPL